MIQKNKAFIPEYIASIESKKKNQDEKLANWEQEYKQEKESFNNFKQELRNQKKEFLNLDKVFLKKAQEINNDIEKIQVEKNECLKRFKEVNQETNIVCSKLNNISRIIKHSQSEIQFHNIKSVPKKLVIKKKRQGMEYVQFGNFEDSENIILCDDTKWVPLDDNHQLVLIKVYSQESKIYGIQCFYKNIKHQKHLTSDELFEDDGKFTFPKLIPGLNNSQAAPSILQQQESETQILKIYPEDSIKSISGIFTDNIQFLQIETYKGDYLKIGKKEGSKLSNAFSYDLKKEQSVNAIYTSLSTTSQSVSPFDYFLTGVGIEISNNHLRKSTLLKKNEEQGEQIEESIVIEDTEDKAYKRQQIMKIRYKLKSKPNNLVVSVIQNRSQLIATPKKKRSTTPRTPGRVYGVESYKEDLKKKKQQSASQATLKVTANTKDAGKDKKDAGKGKKK